MPSSTEALRQPGASVMARYDSFSKTHPNCSTRLATRNILAFALVAALAATACTAAHAQQPATAASPVDTRQRIAHKLTLKGVPNFGEVTPTLYRGAQPTKEGFGNLAKMGIGIVVDLRGSRDSERQLVTKLGMRYVPIPWRCFHPQDRPLAQFLTLLRENPGKKVFVHCRTGDDRTGMNVAAYRITQESWTAQEARNEMEAYGFSLFHRTICPGLASYEEEFPERFKTDPAFQDLRSAGQKPEAQP